MAVDIALRVRTQQLEQALESIPGLTRREVRKAVKGAEREWKRMPAAARKAARESERAMTQRMQLLRRNVSSVMGGVANDIGDAVEMLGLSGSAAAGAGLLATGLAAVGAAAFAAGKRMSDLVDQVGLVSESTGLSTDTVVALRHALAASGADFNAARGALVEWTRRSLDAGIAADNMDGHLRDVLAQLEAIQDPSERAAERVRQFGAEGARALAALSPEKLAAAEDKTRDLAIALGGAAEESQAWDEAFAELSTELDTTAAIIGEQVTPAIVGLIKGVNDLIGPTVTVIQTLRQFDPVAQGINLTLSAFAGSQKVVASNTAAANEHLQRQVNLAERLRLQSTTGLRAQRTAGRPKRMPSSAQRAAAAASSMGQFGPELTMDDDPSSIVETQTTVARLNEQVRQQELAAERAAAEERARIQQMERDQIRETMDMRRQAANELVGSLASTVQALGANADAVAAAALVETIALQAVAVARAFAGDPYTGAVRAAVAIAMIAPQIAQLARVSGRGAASAGGGGGGGGAAASGDMQRGPSRRRERDPSGTITVVSEYRHQLLDRAVQDSTRRIGSPLRQELRARRRR